MLDKTHLEKVAKRSNFSAKYISLPCFVISAIMVFVSVGLQNQQLLILNAVFALFNLLMYWLNTSIRDKCYESIEMLSDLERRQWIRDLKPNKG